MTPSPKARCIRLLLGLALVAGASTFLWPNLPTHAATAYPLKLGPTGHYLVDQNNAPFLLVGDSVWSLIAQGTNADIDTYLNDRQQKGINAIIVNLLEHKFATNAPGNINGDPPFTSTNFTTPNEAYFAHADYVITGAMQRGITVVLFPLYLGFQCGTEGWCQEVQAASSTDMQSWGQYVGNRYKSFDNIVWSVGGDVDPNSAGGLAAKVSTFATALTQTDTRHVVTAHNVRGEMAVTPWPSATWLNLNNTYTTYTTTYSQAQTAYNLSPPMPFFLIEDQYENKSGFSRQNLRSQGYWTAFSGGMGYMYGNCPLWGLGPPAASFCPGVSSDWTLQLNSPGAGDLVVERQILTSVAWQNLVPDFGHTTVTAGLGTFGNTDYLTAARAADGTLVMAYLPTVRAITVDMSQLAGPATAQWIDPTNGTYQTISGSPLANTGNQVLTPPTANAGGDGDWLLILQSGVQATSTSSPTATSTSTATATLTATPTGTATSTGTPSSSATATASATPSSTPAPSDTPTPTASPTATATATATASATPMATATGTATATVSPTASSTPTLTPTATLSPSATTTSTPAPTSTSSPTPDPSATASPTPTSTPSPTPTRTPTATPSPTPTTGPASFCIPGDPSFCAPPVHWWSLNEASGSSVADGGTAPVSGTLKNTPTWTTGKYGSALSFNGTSQYVAFGNTSLNGLSTVTFESWFKRKSLNAIVSVGEEQGPNLDASIETYSDGLVYLNVGSGSGIAYASVASNDTNWHHIAFVFDGTQSGNTNRLKGYLDGVQQTLNFDGTTIPATIHTNDSNFSIGALSSNHDYTNGAIDDVRIYTYARTAAQVQLDQQNGGGSSTPTATPSATPSPTGTASPSPTATATATLTATPSPTSSPSATLTPTPAATSTPTQTATPTFMSTATPTPSPTSTLAPSGTDTATPTASPTSTPSATPVPTDTPSPSATTTSTPAPTSTSSPTPDPSATASPTPTSTPSPTPTRTPTATPSPTPTTGPASFCIPGDPSFCAPPVHWWSLNEASGSSVADGGTAPVSGTLKNTPTWTTGKYGSALSFNGTSQYVAFGNTSLNGLSTVTFESWFKRKSLNAIVSVGEEQGPNLDASIETYSDGLVYLNVGSGSGIAYASVASNDTNWHHIAFVFDGTQSGNTNRLKGYLDGVQQTLNFDGTTIPATIHTNDSNFSIGALSSNHDYTNGTIDDVRIYTYARTAAQVQRDMNNNH